MSLLYIDLCEKSLTAKRAEILEKGKGAFSKYTDKPGYSALNNRMPAPPQSDAQSDNGSYHDPSDGASSVTSSRSAPIGNNGHPGGSRGGRFGPSGGMSLEVNAIHTLPLFFNIF